MISKGFMHRTWMMALVGALCVWIAPALLQAHTMTTAYLDIRVPYSDAAAPLQLTVAIHPTQALTVIGLLHDRHEDDGGFGHQIPELTAHADIIRAYVTEHVEVSVQGVPCEWEPTSVQIPSTELDALADGITITAPLLCEGQPTALEIMSTLFIDSFPDQQNIVRLEKSVPTVEFENRMTLDRQTIRGSLDLSDATALEVPRSETPSAPVGDPRRQMIGWTIFFLVMGAAGFAVYRMNTASPKE